ncbi:MAG: hypothetical protein ACQETM_06200 [Bacteroidota bacterium]
MSTGSGPDLIIPPMPVPCTGSYWKKFPCASNGSAGDVAIPSSDTAGPPAMQQLHLRFANGSASSLFLNPYGLENRHSRFITGRKMAAVCQIDAHLIKKWMLDGTGQDTPQIMRFDYSDPARHLISLFIRSVRTGCKPIFGIDELHQLADLIDHFRTR